MKEPGQGPHNQLGEQMVSFQLIPETSEPLSESGASLLPTRGSSSQQSQQTGALSGFTLAMSQGRKILSEPVGEQRGWWGRALGLQ